MVRLQRVAVGVAERVGELLGGVRRVVAEGLGREVEATGKVVRNEQRDLGERG